jgi:hypothetical protein
MKRCQSLSINIHLRAWEVAILTRLTLFSRSAAVLGRSLLRVPVEEKLSLINIAKFRLITGAAMLSGIIERG